MQTKVCSDNFFPFVHANREDSFAATKASSFADGFAATKAHIRLSANLCFSENILFVSANVQFALKKKVVVAALEL